jgi:N-formylglutamate deformylase
LRYKKFIWHNIFACRKMINVIDNINELNSPLLATAIHNGHDVRTEVEKYLAINKFDRLREEDPYTGYLAEVAGSGIIVNTSRFEVDVNRSREDAIYRTPEQAWGLNVWKEDVPVAVWEYSLGEYDYFYSLLERTINKFIESWGYIIVFDIHSYNYKREGKDKEGDPENNPEINIGTGTMNRRVWGPVVDTFMSQIKSYNYMGEKLDVRENIKFQGGYLAKWIHTRFPVRSCVLSIEFKKFFMDEWSGAVDIVQLKELRKLLDGSISGVLHMAEHKKDKILSSADGIKSVTD